MGKIYVFLYQNLNETTTLGAIATHVIYVFLYQNLNNNRAYTNTAVNVFMYFYIRI